MRRNFVNYRERQEKRNFSVKLPFTSYVNIFEIIMSNHNRSTRNRSFFLRRLATTTTSITSIQIIERKSHEGNQAIQKNGQG